MFRVIKIPETDPLLTVHTKGQIGEPVEVRKPVAGALTARRRLGATADRRDGAGDASWVDSHSSKKILDERMFKFGSCLMIRPSLQAAGTL
jgi:hypothetical protein